MSAVLCTWVEASSVGTVSFSSAIWGAFAVVWECGGGGGGAGAGCLEAALGRDGPGGIEHSVCALADVQVTALSFAARPVNNNL